MYKFEFKIKDGTTVHIPKFTAGSIEEAIRKFVAYFSQLRRKVRYVRHDVVVQGEQYIVTFNDWDITVDYFVYQTEIQIKN